MAVKMNLWSLTLLPGEKYPIYVRRDFQITNAALGEDLKSADGRSVVKVTHNPIPSRALESDDEYDSEFDSEFDDEELDSDLEGDELEDQEEEEAEVEVKPKAGKKAALLAAAAAAAAEEEDDEEMDDEEDDDEDDDSDFSDDDIEETNVICSLTAGKVEQSIVNLTFVEGDVVMFEVSGDNAVHLLGNYIDQFPDVSDDEDSEFSGEDDYSDIYGSDDDEIELDTDEEEAIAKITEIPEEKPKKAIAAKKAAEPAAPAKAAKRKADEIESPAPKAAAAKAAAAADADAEGLSKNQKKKLAKKAKTEEATAPAAAAAAAPAPKKGGKRTLPSGLVIEDIKMGEGPGAKAGRRLSMRYIGKLTNGKQFDANTSGKPFSFVLGRGEVIKGWDEGLVGMAIGGERKLSIPPQLAYGNQKIPGIPKGSTLNFEVKLVSIH
ncbi:hypothetical protein IAU59_007521 [Kwoniella sp. CBS 9459]